MRITPQAMRKGAAAIVARVMQPVRPLSSMYVFFISEKFVVDALENCCVQVLVFWAECFCGYECADVFEGAIIAVAFFACGREEREVSVRWWECCLQVHGF